MLKKGLNANLPEIFNTSVSESPAPGMPLKEAVSFSDSIMSIDMESIMGGGEPPPVFIIDILCEVNSALAFFVKFLHFSLTSSMLRSHTLHLQPCILTSTVNPAASS